MTEKTNLAVDEILIPDCCNLGIVLRILLCVNICVFLAIFSRGQGLASSALEFVESAMIVEWICLISMFSLCHLRRYVLKFALPPAWLQRSVCGLLPVLVTAVSLFFLTRLDWFNSSYPRLQISLVLLSSFLFGMGAQHYFELRTKALSPALGEARLQALQARIRPHFLFNSLNAVLSLIRTEPRRAETALEDLADLFRVLMRDARNMTTLQEEMELVQKYLSIEKIRLGERMQVEWSTGSLTYTELHEIKIASLLLQPLVENAVHYGVEPSVSAAKIVINLERTIDKILISITNPFFEQQKVLSGNQMALDNIRARLQLLYDIEAQLDTQIVDNKFVLILQFPIQR